MGTPSNEVVGGLDEFLVKINAEKKVGRVMGADEKGNKNVDLPAWFERRGIRTFVVDSGLGPVLCRTLRRTIDREGEKDIPEEVLVPAVLEALVKIPPTWCGEETFDLYKTTNVLLKVEDGKPLPSPAEVLLGTALPANATPEQRAAAFEAQKNYLACLPRSLPGQVFIGLGYMNLAPLPMDPTPAT